MKRLKRIVAAVLFLCILISLMPPVQFTRAAEVTRRYELDTDGIDTGATYLIVNTGTAGNANALKFRYGNNSYNRGFTNQSLRVQTDENGTRYIATGFTSEADCLFEFDGTEAGKITHTDGGTTYAIDLTNSRYTTSTSPQSLTFTEVGNGAYRISYSTSSWWNSTTYYLRYNSSSWSRSTTSSNVYLYKLVEYQVGYDIHFDGNGYTSGQLPADEESLESGYPYTIPKAPVELRKDIGQDTWLFLCWNTKPDGSGTEYKPGDEITVTEDLTLYADWYPQTKYVVTMATELNGVRTDVDKISGQNKTFSVRKIGENEPYIPMERTEEGTYIAKVVDNGDYVVYSQVDGGAYEAVHGHMVTIYNQDGITVCQHFSVSYDVNGGVWAEGEAPEAEKHHFGDPVTAYDKTPTKDGYGFKGWKDQNGNVYAAGQRITDSLDKELILTADWEKLITVTVDVEIDHTAESGGTNISTDRDEVVITLLREENGVNLPVAEKVLKTEEPTGDVTVYQVVFEDLPQGEYHVASTKSHYTTTTTHKDSTDGQNIQVNLKYTPQNYDLVFDVVVNADEGEAHLMPSAVNVKISCWAQDDNGNWSWRIITQQEGHHAPTTITIEDGKGSGYFPVWRYAPDTGEAYLYRLEITSFVMPDGSILPATTNNQITYKPDGSGLYQAVVTIEGEGAQPDGTNLEGAFFDGETQNGRPTVTVDITPMKVTFQAAEGTISGQSQLVLDNQYRYPDPGNYTAVPKDETMTFLGWFDQDGNPAQALAGGYLTEDVVYTARYGSGITLSGEVYVATTYTQDNDEVNIAKIDLPKEVMVLVRKQLGGQFVTLHSQLVSVTYEEDAPYGIAEYTFENLPNDGSGYQISVLTANYDSLYDNNGDDSFSLTEDVVIVDPLEAAAKVDAQLGFNPEQYRLGLHVDATQIAEGFRPTSVLAKIMYRDLGDTHPFNVISQHTVAPYGVEIQQDKLGQGYGSDDVWIRHVDGTYYEYQIELSKLSGSVEGAYTNGTDFTENSPFTVVYGPPSNHMNQDADGNGQLQATLVPKEYPVILDLNLGNDTVTPVRGMDNYLVDDGTGNASYAYVHTWSYASTFEAYPYRDGYVFLGWKENADTTDDKELVVEDGVIRVGATLAKPVTLTAQWRKLEASEYTVRHLELNTNKVLHGAQAFGDVIAGSRVVAAERVLSIAGYEYAGAAVEGAFIHKSNNPEMIVSADPLENVLVIYYLPDSSSGYTEQVESNLSMNKTAVLENNGTYTVTLDTYTKDSPVTTRIRYDTPLDVVLVLDQSGSMHTNQALDDLKDAVSNFVTLLADHGRTNEVDHRVAIVGYASDELDGYTNRNYPTAGSDGGYKWYNTGVFGVHGDFHPYSVTGFNYTEYTGLVAADGTYYTKAHDEYLLLTYHEEYRHLITEEEAREALLAYTPVYGYVEGQFVELTRNSSGLWLYGDKKLYTSDEYFTYHTDVWTHREGLERREIHAYGVGNAFKEVGEHQGVYTRTVSKDANPQKSLYEEALIPISLGANGSGGITPGLAAATQKLGGNGTTHVSYGMEMANRVFEANPLEEDSDRLRVVIVFTDGKPGDGSNFDEAEANKALEYAHIASKDHRADIYTIGLYGNDVVEAESDQVFFMNGLSSNYPNATNMDDIWVTTTYQPAESGIRLDLGGPYYVNVGNDYYLLTRSSLYENKTYYNCWGYTDNSGNRVIISKTPTADGHPVITNNKVGDYTIYRQYGDGYKDAANTGYYVEANSSVNLKEYFAKIMRDITTNVTTQIVLEGGTIIRDIMNEGMVLTGDTVITVSTQAGKYNAQTKTIDWAVDNDGAPITTDLAELKLESGEDKASGEENVQIKVYNLDVPNDPNQPHTVDVSGYNFSQWYISESHPDGFKMIVTITGIEARDNVQWGRSTATNHARSGLWLPADSEENRELLATFNQPTTIFVERAYVLDYGKEFTLSGWYFDDEDGNNAEPVHLDLNIADGMNGFDTPNKQNSAGSIHGNTKYGNVRLDEQTEKVYYSPTTMNWGGYDSFYVFGETWRQTVRNQDANANGNLWNKVTVIPANNIYYEDSFITKDPEEVGQNGIQGFTFTGDWTVVGEKSDNNTEIPEHLESAPYGDVHGWTDSLGDDVTYTDGTAHGAFQNGYTDEAKETGAQAQFTFTGTGVEVYTRTNNASGMVVAFLDQVTKGENGQETTTLYQSLAVDNLAMSGDYYHIPTVAFKDLPYGTYRLQLMATVTNAATNTDRYEYYIDGVRIHNPLGNTTSYQSDIIKDAYGLENNAVFTEVRDVLLQYKDFILDMDDSNVGTDGKLGAVFIDWIREGQGNGNDSTGTKVNTYEIGTYKDYGPKNEVYLKSGQAIVLKVAEDNTYYVGLKSLTGEKVTVNLSGLDRAAPVAIEINHTTNMYYRVTPVNGYIVIQNSSDGDKILSVTNLRTTNQVRPAVNGGIEYIAAEESVVMVSTFSAYMEEKANEIPEPAEPEKIIPSVEEQTQANMLMATALFSSVREWLEEN